MNIIGDKYVIFAIFGVQLLITPYLLANSKVLNTGQAEKIRGHDHGSHQECPFEETP